MSKIVKGVGKVFKKVVKTVVKVLPYALAAAAVVFTGGAALGLGGIFAGGFSGAVGGLVGSLGLSGAAAGALTGAITSAGFGAAAGGILGGTKGLKQGALMGAMTGGVLGAVSPGTFAPKGGLGSGLPSSSKLIENVAAQQGTSVYGGLSAPASVSAAAAASAPAQVAATQTAVNSATTGTSAGGTSGAGSTVANAGAPLTPTAAGSGGVLGFFNANPALAGSMLTGVASTLGGESYGKKLSKEEKALARAAERSYGGVYSGQANPFGAPGDYGTAPATITPSKRWVYDTSTHTMKEVPV